EGSWLHCRRAEADSVVNSIRDINIPRAVHRYTLRTIKPRGVGRAISAARDRRQTGKSGHCSSRRNPPDGMVLRVRYINTARAVHGHTMRKKEARDITRAVGSARAAG